MTLDSDDLSSRGAEGRAFVMRANLYEERLKPEAQGTEPLFAGSVLTVRGSPGPLVCGLVCAEPVR